MTRFSHASFRAANVGSRRRIDYAAVRYRMTSALTRRHTLLIFAFRLSPSVGVATLGAITVFGDDAIRAARNII